LRLQILPDLTPLPPFPTREGGFQSLSPLLLEVWRGVFFLFRRCLKNTKEESFFSYLCVLCAMLRFVRREFSKQGIGRELFTRCTNDLNEVTVNAAEAAVGFYQKVGFIQSGNSFFKHGICGTPMKWVNNSVN
jgi:GNAT superfamily N-acetyltransferase